MEMYFEGVNIVDKATKVRIAILYLSDIVTLWWRRKHNDIESGMWKIDELKWRLTEAPILAIPEGSEGYEVYTDASGIGLGCVLMQNGKVIAYGSRQLRPHEKNYPIHDMELATVYRPGRANVVTDALSRKGIVSRMRLQVDPWDKIKLATAHEGNLEQWIDENGLPKQPEFKYRNGILRMNGQRDVAEFVRACDTCQRIKAKHQKPSRSLQPLEIPEWKLEHVTTDFIMGLPRTLRKADAIWVVVDRLTKLAYFLPIRSTIGAEQLAQLFIQEIVHLHEVPVSIVSDRDSRFMSNFWKAVQEELGT
ncbi:uncharacterized protein LOC127799781 [Diospyros lotus]|uniref:uncharacterized protein LOC127799781 n=1 Tax=Diospyros lotus TaxID=55363 RepID=UPI002251FC22|nr:uncharacterized protein LOC127799781 [Diospyros lotus]